MANEGVKQTPLFGNLLSILWENNFVIYFGIEFEDDF